MSYWPKQIKECAQVLKNLFFVYLVKFPSMCLFNFSPINSDEKKCVLCNCASCKNICSGKPERCKVSLEADGYLYSNKQQDKFMKVHC